MHESSKDLFRSLRFCEHHVLPFFGRAWVGYVASDRVIGISKLTRLVRQYSRRFTVQERIGSEVAKELESIVGARDGGSYRGGAFVHAHTRRARKRHGDLHDGVARTLRSERCASPEFFELCSGR